MQNQRVHSLDILRAGALLTMMLWHAPKTLHAPFGPYAALAWQSIDLFFVLSGFLIADLVFEPFLKTNKIFVKNFYIRRALRIIPAYWFVLALYFLIPAVRSAPDMSPLWRFLTFTLNLDQQQGINLGHAWSLCVEEQFYFVFPIVTAWFLPKRHFKLAVAFLVLLLIGGISLRAWLWTTEVEGHQNWLPLYMHWIYFPTWGRLDSIVFGISIAAFKNFLPVYWEKYTRQGNWYLAVSAVLIFISANYFLGDIGLFTVTLGYTLSCLGYTFLVLAGLSRNSWLASIYIPGAKALAVWSYSTYLLHIIIYQLGFNFLNQQLGIPIGFLSFAIVLATSIAVGGISYKLIEKPFLRLREKHFPAA